MGCVTNVAQPIFVIFIKLKCVIAFFLRLMYIFAAET